MTKLASLTFAAVLCLSSLALPFLTDPLPATPPSIASEEFDVPAIVQTTEQVVSGLISAIRQSRAPLPAWALDAANKAVTHWKLHRLSQKSAEIEKEVIAMLRTVYEIKSQVEAGRALSDRESLFARAVLEAHDRRLSDLTDRVDAVEAVTRDAEPRIARLEADKSALVAENNALRVSISELRKRLLQDRCGRGRKRGPHGCMGDPQ